MPEEDSPSEESDDEKGKARTEPKVIPGTPHFKFVTDIIPVENIDAAASGHITVSLHTAVYEVLKLKRGPPGMVNAILSPRRVKSDGAVALAGPTLPFDIVGSLDSIRQ